MTTITNIKNWYPRNVILPVIFFGLELFEEEESGRVQGYRLEILKLAVCKLYLMGHSSSARSENKKTHRNADRVLLGSFRRELC